MNLVLQSDDFIALVLDLLDVLLFADPLLEDGALIQLHQSLQISNLTIRLLGYLEEIYILTLLSLNTSLRILDLLLYLE